MTIRYVTEAEHTERMAKAIYLCHVRRVTMIIGWDRLNEDRREAFRSLARDAIAGADRIRAAARDPSIGFAGTGDNSVGDNSVDEMHALGCEEGARRFRCAATRS
jgi:hypothetical protein